jgi:hypothetical protein
MSRDSYVFFLYLVITLFTTSFAGTPTGTVTPHQNSLGDLKIPTRISDEVQVGRRNLGIRANVECKGNIIAVSSTYFLRTVLK